MTMSEKSHIDQVSGVETTGHEWDGIRELNNPLPRWWLWIFYATIVYSIGYMIWFPAIPLLNGNTPGLSGETNRGKLQAELAAVAQEREAITAQISASSLEEIRDNPELQRFAAASGSSLFKVNCSQCHGSGAQGGPGYPNLNDDDWIWGGSLEAIHQTIAHGVRFEEDDDTRFGEMPAFGRDELLERDEMTQTAEFVLKLSGQSHDPAAAEAGQVLFEENCAACHGEAGGGDVEAGAPALNDTLWLYGGAKDQILAQLNQPKHGVMPAWQQRLGEVAVKELAIYVHSLGGGQ